MIASLALAFLVLTACRHLTPPSPSPSPNTTTPAATLDAADAAAFASNYSEASRLYAWSATNDPDPKKRARATVRLANIEWRIFEHPEAAITRLRAATESGSEHESAFEEWSRLERERHHFADAERLARKAIEAASTEQERTAADATLASAIIEAHVEARLDHVATPPADLREGFTIATKLVAAQPGNLRASLLLLDASLLLGEPDGVMQAWRSYFGATAESNILAPARRALEAALPDWRKSEIADALAASRLFTPAALLVDATERPDLVAYESWTRRVTKLTNDYYRALAQKSGGNAEAWNAQVIAETQTLWTTLHWDGAQPPPFDPKMLDGTLDGPLAQRFGLVLNIGKTGGVLDAHIGHIVSDERRTVDQYGHKADVRFVKLDTMLSDGFETWSWDQRALHGGWGGASEIVQVRPAYAAGPLFEWLRRTLPGRRKTADDDLARETAADSARAAADPYAFLPGLALRLGAEADDAMIARLEARGLAGDALRDAFLTEWGRAIDESSIFAHEGRHAIDASIPGFDAEPDTTHEYRAKLSEIAFAPEPRLALTSGIVAGQPDTPHGHANRLVMQDLVKWMTAHSSEIAGLDTTRPLLPQLDKLTDDQLRAAARDSDPMAKP